MKKYIVIETFKPDCADTNMDRFNTQGRMFPEGLYFLNAWLNEAKTVCFQLIETTDDSLINQWIELWSDLSDFEIHPVS